MALFQSKSVKETKKIQRKAEILVSKIGQVWTCHLAAEMSAKEVAAEGGRREVNPPPPSAGERIGPGGGPGGGGRGGERGEEEGPPRVGAGGYRPAGWLWPPSVQVATSPQSDVSKQLPPPPFTATAATVSPSFSTKIDSSFPPPVLPCVLPLAAASAPGQPQMVDGRRVNTTCRASPPHHHRRHV